MDSCIYEKWYDQYVDSMFSYGMAMTHCADRDLVMDAIHDVFLHLYEVAGKIDTPGNPKFYLLRALKNRIISSKRKEVPMLSLDDGADYDFSIKVDALAMIVDKEERQAYEAQVERLLGLLTGKQREVIYLHFMQELSYDEIGEMLHITAHSVQKMVYRAIGRMHEAALFPMLVFIIARSSLQASLPTVTG